MCDHLPFTKSLLAGEEMSVFSRLRLTTSQSKKLKINQDLQELSTQCEDKFYRRQYKY